MSFEVRTVTWIQFFLSQDYTETLWRENKSHKAIWHNANVNVQIHEIPTSKKGCKNSSVSVLIQQAKYHSTVDYTLRNQGYSRGLMMLVINNGTL